MNLKEHLQLLVMMIPTLLLLAAATFSLAFPAQGAGAPPVRLALAAEHPGIEFVIAEDTEVEPARSDPAR